MVLQPVEKLSDEEPGTGSSGSKPDPKPVKLKPKEKAPAKPKAKQAAKKKCSEANQGSQGESLPWERKCWRDWTCCPWLGHTQETPCSFRCFKRETWLQASSEEACGPSRWVQGSEGLLCQGSQVWLQVEWPWAILCDFFATSSIVFESMQALQRFVSIPQNDFFWNINGKNTFVPVQPNILPSHRWVEVPRRHPEGKDGWHCCSQVAVMSCNQNNWNNFDISDFIVMICLLLFPNVMVPIEILGCTSWWARAYKGQCASRWQFEGLTIYDILWLCFWILCFFGADAQVLLYTVFPCFQQRVRMRCWKQPVSFKLK